MNGRHGLAETIAAPGITVVPGVYDGSSARLVEQRGFASGFLSGAGVSNSRLAQPDVGFLTLPDVADQSREIVDAVSIPIWVEADTGYGNAVAVHRTVRRPATAGAAAVVIEDQEWPKRCGHMAGESVLPFEEAVTKIEAADLDVTSRVVTTRTPHHSYATTGATCLAAATRLDGTIPAEFARPADGADVTIGHPKGTITIGVETGSQAGTPTVERVRVSRTVRLLVDGKFYYRVGTG
jgi:2-methylisocitrate lyase-like PEP mutase family enzyme